MKNIRKACWCVAFLIFWALLIAVLAAKANTNFVHKEVRKSINHGLFEMSSITNCCRRCEATQQYNISVRLVFLVMSCFCFFFFFPSGALLLISSVLWFTFCSFACFATCHSGTACGGVGRSMQRATT